MSRSSRQSSPSSVLVPPPPGASWPPSASCDRHPHHHSGGGEAPSSLSSFAAAVVGDEVTSASTSAGVATASSSSGPATATAVVSAGWAASARAAFPSAPVRPVAGVESTTPPPAPNAPIAVSTVAASSATLKCCAPSVALPPPTTATTLGPGGEPNGGGTDGSGAKKHLLMRLRPTAVAAPIIAPMAPPAAAADEPLPAPTASKQPLRLPLRRLPPTVRPATGAPSAIAQADSSTASAEQRHEKKDDALTATLARCGPPAIEAAPPAVGSKRPSSPGPASSLDGGEATTARPSRVPPTESVPLVPAMGAGPIVAPLRRIEPTVATPSAPTVPTVLSSSAVRPDGSRHHHHHQGGGDVGTATNVVTSLATAAVEPRTANLLPPAPPHAVAARRALSVSPAPGASPISRNAPPLSMGRIHPELHTALPAAVPVTPYTVSDPFETRYRKEIQISEGTYGEVFLGVDLRTGHKVALKKLKVLEQLEGFPITSIREIVIHRHLATLVQQQQQGGNSSSSSSSSSSSLLQYVSILKDVCVSKDWQSTYLVFDVVNYSLAGLLSKKFQFRAQDVGCIIGQSLIALQLLHGCAIVHRDIKANNILLSDRGVVKLCDFGLAFATTSDRVKHTPSLVAMDFRAPEMLLHVSAYGGSVDVWALGCVLAQIFIGCSPFSQQFHKSSERIKNYPWHSYAAKLDEVRPFDPTVKATPPATPFNDGATSKPALDSELTQLVVIARVFGVKVFDLLPIEEVQTNCDGRAAAVVATHKSAAALGVGVQLAPGVDRPLMPPWLPIAASTTPAEAKRKHMQTQLRKFLTNVTPRTTTWNAGIPLDAMDAIVGLLVPDPRERPTAAAALTQIDFFSRHANDVDAREMLQRQVKGWAENGFCH